MATPSSAKAAATASWVDKGSLNGELHRGHEAALKPEAVVEHLSQGGQAIGGAGCVAEDAMPRLENLVVDPENHHRVHISLRGDRENNLAGSGVEVLGAGFPVAEDSGGLDHKIHPEVAPRQRSGVALGRETGCGHETGRRSSVGRCSG